ncbi:MAG TPA: hypothetical protein VI729_12470 [Anaerolineales bacterium]|nr:hypothetical protein [Anaerolineales bacterium]
MDIRKAFPKKWLNADDLDEQGMNLTIKRVDIEMLEDGEKVVVSFREVEKGLVLNKTNAKTIARLHGPETNAWVGQRITLYRTEVDFKGERVQALRVHLTAPEAPREASRPAGRPSKTLDDFFDEPGPEPQDTGEAAADIPF